ncbi:TetR/AcrR family transcriptional regulator [uncultured Croceicoccus sp.]|uniref:TetR/AcrR family transcriptional regulator n=1 Tax=uncultured Croceicoccus sp. TaxID=1295329 RepID=UPI002605A6B1|nr:TetR/AcrR family transcriptional regulator [uncultured Croceicoccus sp.]
MSQARDTDVTSAAARPSREELYALAWEAPLAQAAARIGMSPTGFARLCDRMDVPRPPRAFWSAKGRDTVEKPPLPSVATGGGDAAPKRTRMPIARRREHLLDIAAEIARTRGPREISLRQVARDAGISEAQAHNCYAGRRELLMALAYRELRRGGPGRPSRQPRGHDPRERLVLSITGYLHEAALRGPLLQSLMQLPEVREGLRDERAIASARARSQILAAIHADGTAPDARAQATNAALTQVCMRAGGMVAANRHDSWDVARLCLATVIAGTRAVAALTRADGTAQ